MLSPLSLVFGHWEHSLKSYLDYELQTVANENFHLKFYTILKLQIKYQIIKNQFLYFSTHVITITQDLFGLLLS